jgi:SAM-dependent methyltransferase
MLTSVQDADERFAFGKNWAAFLRGLDDQRIAEAEKSVRALLGMQSLEGKTFLDIGSGSALFSLVARRLGACVYSFDFDEDAVNCGRTLRERYFPDDENWSIQQGSILDSAFVQSLGRFDIVYSWGVLHHTGAMYQAIENAASCVKPGGIFAIALYRKTLLCKFWKVEKKWYAGASERGQAIARSTFELMIRLAFWKNGRNFKDHVANYHSVRGMDYQRDLHDWLGGYPYESITPQQTAALMQRIGFAHVRSNLYPKYPHGLLGSGCDEFVYRRPEAAPAG